MNMLIYCENGNLTISGLPNGQTRENTFSGKRVGS